MNSNVTNKNGKLMHAKRFSGILLNNLNKQRDDSTFCDVDFIIGPQKKKISAHRCIMAAASPYFTAMFANNFNESKQREVIIQDVNADDFEFLIEFCYSATIHVNNENAKRILQAAHCFQFPDIINACGQYLKGQMNPSICLGIANLAEYLDLKDLHQSAMEFAYQNFVGVSKNDEFMLLDIQTLSHLLQRNDLVVCTEEDVFRAMLTWIQYDIEDREKFTGDLLKMIRLTRLNIATTVDELKKLSTTAESKNLLIDALVCQLVPQRRREVEDRGISTKSRKYTDEGKIITIGNRDFLTEKTAIEIYTPGENKWTVAKVFNKRQNFAATIMNNKLVIGGGQKSNGDVLDSVLMYDLKTFELDKLPPMNEKRYSFELCFLDGCLYAIGGFSTKTVERFCFTANVWHFVAPLVPQRSGFSATVLDSRLYIVGGKLTQDSSLLNRVDCFDPLNNKWRSRASMTCNRSNPAVSAAKGFLYVYSASSLERYDSVSNSWMVQSIPTFSRDYSYRFLDNHNLFLIGQNEETEISEDNVEIEEFEEIEEDDDEEDVVVVNERRDRSEANVVNERIERPNANLITVESEAHEEPVHIERNEIISLSEDFDEKFIKKYCLESGAITKLPIMNVIRKIEFLIQIPNGI